MKNFIALKDIDYSLPQEYIPLYPLAKRDCCKLLIYKDKKISEDIFYNFPNIISDKYCLILNNTKVIHCKFFFEKLSGKKVEIFCLQPLPHNWEIAFSSYSPIQFVCQTKGWKKGSLCYTKQGITLKVSITDNIDDKKIIKFVWDAKIRFQKIINIFGNIPIPPYLKRENHSSDIKNYQAIYAEHLGSIASPTSGLHFTEKTFKDLRAKNIDYNFLTLNINSDTFKSIKEENVYRYRMHGEDVLISKQFLKNILEKKSKIICCGTTTLRALESILYLGQKISWDKNTDMTKVSQEAFSKECRLITNNIYISTEILLDYLNKQKSEHLSFRTSIMISPPYKPKSCHALLTNFHQPKSSLLLLISSIVGDDWRCIYTYALDKKFRFLSYGDCSLLFNDL